MELILDALVDYSLQVPCMSTSMYGLSYERHTQRLMQHNNSGFDLCLLLHIDTYVKVK